MIVNNEKFVILNVGPSWSIHFPITQSHADETSFREDIYSLGAISQRIHIREPKDDPDLLLKWNYLEFTVCYKDIKVLARLR